MSTIYTHTHTHIHITHGSAHTLTHTHTPITHGCAHIKRHTQTTFNHLWCDSLQSSSALCQSGSRALFDDRRGRPCLSEAAPDSQWHAHVHTFWNIDGKRFFPCICCCLGFIFPSEPLSCAPTWMTSISNHLTAKYSTWYFIFAFQPGWHILMCRRRFKDLLPLQSGCSCTPHLYQAYPFFLQWTIKIKVCFQQTCSPQYIDWWRWCLSLFPHTDISKCRIASHFTQSLHEKATQHNVHSIPF